jgi:hypothetical protein
MKSSSMIEAEFPICPVQRVDWDDSFQSSKKNLIFEYSGNSFELSYSNDVEFGDVELEVKHKASIGDDIEFADYGNRKIQKGEFVLELDNIKVMKVNQGSKSEECKLVELELNLYVKKMNIRTKLV